MPDLAELDLFGPLPCVAPSGGFCVWGTVLDFATKAPAMGTHVVLSAGPATLAETDGPYFSLEASSVPTAAALIVTGSGRTPSLLAVSPGANDAFRIDPFAVSSTLTSGGALELFFTDFAPSPTKQTLGDFRPAAGVTVTLHASADGGTATALYVAADRAHVDGAATSTTVAGAALHPQDVTADASGGSCTGPCSWQSVTVPLYDPSFVLLVPRYP